MAPVRTLILGAAGRDFHTFNLRFRERDDHRVVAFTAGQIPNISDRSYPPELAGPLYPEGIPVRPEGELERWIRELEVELCVLSYSDLSHEAVMHLASRVGAAGADFTLFSPRSTMLRAERPVVAVTAVRTGVGKSQTSRAVVRLLREAGHRVVVLRHPMPYGDLAAQAVQRFGEPEDLDRHRVTIEEREEYEPHIGAGTVVYAGVDYAAILARAEEEADVLVWDGGNNDTPFLYPDIHVTLADPHRPGHELRYHPGETNLRMADAVLIAKVDTADADAVLVVRRNVEGVNPAAVILEGASPLFVDEPEVLRGRRVLVVEDGPTLTHGEMAYGAGTLGARRSGAAELMDPRSFARGEIRETFRRHPHMGPLLPAMGYGEGQIRELEETIARAVDGGVEAVAVGTPVDLGAVLRIPVPHTRVRYELQVLGRPHLEDVLRPLLERGPGSSGRGGS